MRSTLLFILFFGLLCSTASAYTLYVKDELTVDTVQNFCVLANGSYYCTTSGSIELNDSEISIIYNNLSMRHYIVNPSLPNFTAYIPTTRYYRAYLNPVDAMTFSPLGGVNFTLSYAGKVVDTRTIDSSSPIYINPDLVYDVEISADGYIHYKRSVSFRGENIYFPLQRELVSQAWDGVVYTIFNHLPPSQDTSNVLDANGTFAPCLYLRSTLPQFTLVNASLRLYIDDPFVAFASDYDGDSEIQIIRDSLNGYIEVTAPDMNKNNIIYICIRNATLASEEINISSAFSSNEIEIAISYNLNSTIYGERHRELALTRQIYDFEIEPKGFAQEILSWLGFGDVALKMLPFVAMFLSATGAGYFARKGYPPIPVFIALMALFFVLGFYGLKILIFTLVVGGVIALRGRFSYEGT